jgi:hypothetical protein
VLAEHDELIAAHPRHHFSRTNDLLEPPWGFGQHPVSGLVAEDVVHVLEPVEIEVEDDNRTAARVGSVRGMHQQLLEARAIREARERVVRRLMLELRSPGWAPRPRQRSARVLAVGGAGASEMRSLRIRIGLFRLDRWVLPRAYKVGPVADPLDALRAPSAMAGPG